MNTHVLQYSVDRIYRGSYPVPGTEQDSTGLDNCEDEIGVNERSFCFFYFCKAVCIIYFGVVIV